MSADLLREAAALMRERAECATPGSWRTGRSVYRTLYAADELVGYLDRRDDATHIASWHPVVALAVALLLDNEAYAIEGAHVPVNHARMTLLTKVARAYLGRES